MAFGYVLGAEICSWLPRHQDFANSGPIQIYVQSNGVHTDLVLPAYQADLDWRSVFEARHFPTPVAAQSADWIAVGWGDQGFFLSTPSWSELTLSTTIGALSARAPSVLHVEYLSEAQRQHYTMHPLQIDASQLRALTDYVRATVHLDARGKAQALSAHYHDRDAFFLAHGHYSVVRTCNTWTGSALSHAQIQIGAWTPFERNVMRSLPPKPERAQ